MEKPLRRRKTFVHVRAHVGQGRTKRVSQENLFRYQEIPHEENQDGEERYRWRDRRGGGTARSSPPPRRFTVRSFYS
eukprot:95212-Prorocentrum_minimum.AAC.1